MAQELQRILVMRHPQTTANLDQTLSGRRNVDLSPKGEEQARRAVDAIVTWKPDRILTSPLQRCTKLAYAAGKRLGIEPQVEGRIIEMDFGEAEGLSAQEAYKRGWSFPWALDAEGHSITAPGGETYEHALARVQSLLDDLESVRGRTVLLTHGGISRSILRAIYGTPADRFWRIQISNVSSFVLSYDGKRYFLAALGLTPEEVKRRVEEDVVKDLDNWDGDAK